MKSSSSSALTISAVVVTLCCCVTSAFLFYQNIGHRWAYLVAILVLAGGWVLQRITNDKRSVQSSIVLAGLLLLIAMLEKVAHNAGWATGADIDQRLFGVLLGAIVVAASNAVPKQMGSALALSTRRIIGWALVLGGLSYALAWLLLPLPIASNVALIALLLGLVTGIAAYVRSWFVALVVLILTFAGTAQAQAHDITGPWHGTLRTSAGSFGLELLIQRGTSGAISATLESVDQAPGEKIPVDVTVRGDDVHVAMKSLGASFDGHITADGTTIDGSWEQGATLPLSFARGPVPADPAIPGLDGTWRGILTRDATQLHLVLHVSTSSHGTRMKLDSPDMNLANLDITDLSRNTNQIHFRVPIARVIFEGTLDAEGHEMRGTWLREGQAPATLAFTHDDPLHVVPAATPAPRYLIEPVRFENARAQITLAGTLTLPRNALHVPAVVLISGSGPEDRDESLFGQKPFAVLADYLTQHGIAVLRYDDRGVGESTGTFSGATIQDFVGDARAAVAFLQSRPEVDRHAIGLIGHSQGGVVGPLVAMHNPSIAYLVLLAAPATDMRELLLSQRRMESVLRGDQESSLAAAEPLLNRLYTVSADAPDRKTAQNRIASMLTQGVLTELGVGSTPKEAIVAQLTSDWLRSLLRYNARATLQALTIPILALNGSLDQQVAANENLTAIRAATTRNHAVMTQELPGLNHLFQPAHTGAIGEYATIHDSFSPSALSTISDWISRCLKQKR